ncbi:MAG: ABC transporter permease, partial [Rhodospirillales bacterium]|nr:ABC transporter permease [Rhodospirillales bacterium]
MFSTFEWMVALRYLRARRQEGFISVIAWFSLLGIALGVATLIIVMSVMNGFRQELLTRILGLNGHVNVYASADGMKDYDSVASRIVDIDGLVTLSPIVEGQVMATGRNGARGALVRGIRPADLSNRNIVVQNIRFGTLEAFEGEDAVVVGERLAAALGLNVGDSITLISPKGNVTAFGTVPRMKAYRIVATFNVGMFEYDSSFIFMPLEAAQVYFKSPDRINFLEVMTNNPDTAPRLSLDIVQRLGPGFRVLDWQQTNASFFNAIQVERNVMFLILTLIIIVAAFNIVSSLIMLVKDKGRDIAILRTMGA